MNRVSFSTQIASVICDPHTVTGHSLFLMRLLLAFEAKEHQSRRSLEALSERHAGRKRACAGSNALAVALCTNTFDVIFCRSNTHTRTLFFRHRLALECANISKGM